MRLGFVGSGPGADLMERYVFPGLPRAPRGHDDFTFRLEHGDGGFKIDRDGARYGSAGGPDEAMVALQQAIDERVVQNAAGFAFVHCGAVGLDGAAALLIAASGQGKSTLVAALAPHVEYYSDEYAAIDSGGRLHPYPRSLLLRSGQPRQRPVTPLELGGRVARGPAEIRFVLEIPYAPGASVNPMQAVPVEQSVALQVLLKSTPQALEEHPSIFGALARVAAGARAFSGVRGEAEAAAREISKMFIGQRTAGPERGETRIAPHPSKD